jgi:hypothetical protein
VKDGPVDSAEEEHHGEDGCQEYHQDDEAAEDD